MYIVQTIPYIIGKKKRGHLRARLSLVLFRKGRRTIDTVWRASSMVYTVALSSDRYTFNNECLGQQHDMHICAR